ncbi:hypothetical protein [Paraferrimonas sedimenticola]|uniref:Uncharacterized protein n=1 Tax=Paraferrimonas sedimenticola TaxID=375674 RepID=A0AA37RVY0_9GAMM|nr:hypothetical protein [Paraferrimonas sedimenticola]GLP96330.1 hypothetical protein GCM10007895_16360 [Paraferrimonas sedimenticola]
MPLKRIEQILDQHFGNSHDDDQQVQWQRSGSFHYWLNDELTDVVEPWRIGTNPQGVQCIQSVRVSEQYGLVLAADWQQDGEQTHAKVWMRAQGQPEVQAHYNIEGNVWQARHRGPQGERQQQGECVKGLVFFPLLRVFSGAMLLAMQKPGLTLLLPDIEISCPPNDKLLPKQDLRQSFLLEEQPTVAAQAFGMRGGHYKEDNASFEIDQSGLLHRYLWKQSDTLRWRVENRFS